MKVVVRSASALMLLTLLSACSQGGSGSGDDGTTPSNTGGGNNGSSTTNGSSNGGSSGDATNESTSTTGGTTGSTHGSSTGGTGTTGKTTGGSGTGQSSTTSNGGGSTGTSNASSTGGTSSTTGNNGGNDNGNNGTTGGATGTSDGTGSAVLGDVSFTVPSQSFKGQLSVGMSTAASGAEIRYTTDGSVPTASSKLYDGNPLTITGTTQLRAQPFAQGAAAGESSTAIYIARDFDATSDIPLIIVDGYGKGKPSTTRNADGTWTTLDAAVMTFEPVDGSADFNHLPTLASRAGYHTHGQSSATFAQGSYRIELWDNADNDLHQPVLGMPADSDWVLIAPFYDRALIRNTFVYTLAQDLGWQAPRVKYAEVYINYSNRPVQSGDYAGIYYVTETIKDDKNRTNLKSLDPDDTTEPKITGGYIIEFNYSAKTDSPSLTCTGSTPLGGGGVGGGFGGGIGGGVGGGGMGTAGGTCFSDLFVIDPGTLAPEQKTWINQYVQQFHDSLHTTPIGNYGQYIDLPSFVDYFIINELSRNIDEFTRSAYYYKDRNGPLTAGPYWDYNLAFGVGFANINAEATGWEYTQRTASSDWFPRLVTDQAFMTQVKSRWKDLRQGLLSASSISQRISTLSAPLKNAAVRDFAKWPVNQVFKGGGVAGFTVVGPTAATFDGQLQGMNDWITQRLAWMDQQLQ